MLDVFEGRADNGVPSFGSDIPVGSSQMTRRSIMVATALAAATICTLNFKQPATAAFRQTIPNPTLQVATEIRQYKGRFAEEYKAGDIRIAAFRQTIPNPTLSIAADIRQYKGCFAEEFIPGNTRVATFRQTIPNPTLDVAAAIRQYRNLVAPDLLYEAANPNKAVFAQTIPNQTIDLANAIRQYRNLSPPPYRFEAPNKNAAAFRQTIFNQTLAILVGARYTSFAPYLGAGFVGAPAAVVLTGQLWPLSAGYLGTAGPY